MMEIFSIKQLFWFKWFSIFCLILGVLGISSCGNQAELQRPNPLPQDSFIKVYFNHNQSQGANYTEPNRNVTRSGDNLEQILIDAIKSANSTIDVAVQELRLPNIAKALVKQSQNNIKVRIILESNYSRPISEFTQKTINKIATRKRDRYQEYFTFIDINQDGSLSSQEIRERDALIILKNANIPIIDDTEDGTKGTGLMHHKFMIIDNKTVLTGSANFTLSGIHGDFTNIKTRGNANNLLKINSPQIAQIFTEEFNLMWGDGMGGKPNSKFGVNKPQRSPQTILLGDSTVTIKFSPNSLRDDWSITSNGLIGQTLSIANDSIDLALFVFTEQKIANILEKRQGQGVAVKALIDPEFAFRNYSEGLDMLGVALSNNCRYETDNRPWVNKIDTVGIPQLQKGDKLHHKFGVIDNNIVITGSHNWSAAANNQNDETLLIINNPIIAAHYQREFERLYSKSVLGLPDFVIKRIAKDAENCPTFSTSNSFSEGNQLINVNTANQRELESLPGIGEALAQRIIEERRQNKFTSLNDLTRVSGIGEGKIKQLEGKVTW